MTMDAEPPGRQDAAPDTHAEADRDAAFGQVLVELQPRLRAFLGTLVGRDGPLPTDDLAQETLARAWRSRARFDAARGEVAAWLLRIAFRVFLDAQERRGPTTALDAAPIPPILEPGPAQRATARDQARALLSHLSTREREVLLRFHRDGQSVRAIAAALGAPIGTVKSDLHRARHRLWQIERSQ